jgi:hypothetical protein
MRADNDKMMRESMIRIEKVNRTLMKKIEELTENNSKSNNNSNDKNDDESSDENDDESDDESDDENNGENNNKSDSENDSERNSENESEDNDENNNENKNENENKSKHPQQARGSRVSIELDTDNRTRTITSKRKQKKRERDTSALFTAVNDGNGLYSCSIKTQPNIDFIALSSGFKQLYTDGSYITKSLEAIVKICLKRADLTHLLPRVLNDSKATTVRRFPLRINDDGQGWKGVRKVFERACTTFEEMIDADDYPDESVALRVAIWQHCEYVPELDKDNTWFFWVERAQNKARE